MRFWERLKQIAQRKQKIHLLTMLKSFSVWDFNFVQKKAQILWVYTGNAQHSWWYQEMVHYMIHSYTFGDIIFPSTRKCTFSLYLTLHRSAVINIMVAWLYMPLKLLLFLNTRPRQKWWNKINDHEWCLRVGKETEGGQKAFLHT